MGNGEHMRVSYLKPNQPALQVFLSSHLSLSSRKEVTSSVGVEWGWGREIVQDQSQNLK